VLLGRFGQSARLETTLCPYLRFESRIFLPAPSLGVLLPPHRALAPGSSPISSPATLFPISWLLTPRDCVSQRAGCPGPSFGTGERGVRDAGELWGSRKPPSVWGLPSPALPALEQDPLPGGRGAMPTHTRVCTLLLQ